MPQFLTAKTKPKILAILLLSTVAVVLLQLMQIGNSANGLPRTSKSVQFNNDASIDVISGIEMTKKNFTSTANEKENIAETKRPTIEKQELSPAADTIAAFSTWKLITTDPVQGEPINILLTARDKTHQIQSKGKDLIYPKIVNPSLGLSQMGRVRDYENGTYLITFLPGWAGTAEIKVTLFMTARVGFYVNSHQNVEYLFICTYDKMKTKGLDLWKTAPHPKDSLRLKPSGDCYFDSDLITTPRNACDVSKPYQGWFGYCMLPSGANCDELTWCYHSSDMPARKGIFWENGVIRKDNVNQLLRGDQVKITIGTAKSPKPTSPCHQLQYIRLQGYWKNIVYYNTNCHAHCDTKERLNQCLQNMNLTVLGDSTVRQLVIFIQDFIHEDLMRMVYQDNFQYTKRNLAVHFSFHGLPIMTANSAPFTFVKWSSETIDEINPPDEGQATYILISMIHHSVITPATMIKRRLTNLRDALVRLNRRAPLAKTIFLNANARGGNESSINDYKIRYFNGIAYKIIKDVPGVVFVDRWEMYLGSPFPPKVHYPAPVIGELLKIVCSIFRPKSDCRH